MPKQIETDELLRKKDDYKLIVIVSALQDCYAYPRIILPKNAKPPNRSPNTPTPS